MRKWCHLLSEQEESGQCASSRACRTAWKDLQQTFKTHERRLNLGSPTTWGDLTYTRTLSVPEGWLACTSVCEGSRLSSDRWCKVLLRSSQSLSKCDSGGEMAENVSGLWTPPGALSNLFWRSRVVMVICCSQPLCTQPEAHHTVVTTLRCDIASSRVVRLKKVWLCSLNEGSEADCGQRKQDIGNKMGKQC